MTGTALDPELDALEPEIRMQILRYRYRLPVQPDDLARLADIRPTVRRWAAAGRPNSAWEAGRLMRTASGFALSARRTVGTDGLDGALTPGLAAQWIGAETAGKSGWLRRNAWWALTKIGRAVNPGAWPPEGDCSALADSLPEAESEAGL